MLDVSYVHIGAPKTGTKSIQRFLSSNRAVLKEFGYSYPGNDRWHNRLASFCSGSSPRNIANQHSRGHRTAAEIQEADHEFERNTKLEVSDPELTTAIFSYEGLYSKNISFVKELQKFTNEISKSTKIVVYVRNPISWCRSAYSTRALLGFWDGFDIAKSISAKGVLEVYCEVFGKKNVIVRRFDKEFLCEGDLRKDFLLTVGIPPDDISRFKFPEQRSNESVSAFAIGVSKSIAQQVSPPASQMDYNRALQKALRDLPGKNYELSERDKESILEKNSEELEFLESEFDIRFDTPANDQSTSTLPNRQNESVDQFLEQIAEPIQKVISKALELQISQCNTKMENFTGKDLGFSDPLSLLEQDANAHRTRLAKWLDRLDFRFHMTLASTNVLGPKFKEKFMRGAKKRYRSEYGAQSLFSDHE